MKKTAILFCLIANCVIATCQELTTDKAETISLLTNHFSKTNGLIMKDEEGDYTLKDCKISFERGVLKITQTVYRSSSDFWTDIYQFSPLYIEGVGDASNDYKREKEDMVGSIRIFNPNRKVFWKKKAPENKEEIFWHNSTISLYTYYDGEKDANKIKKALVRLQQLLKEESNPFELTTDEKRLSALFAKYKICETASRPSGSFKGSKIKAEDMLLTLHGPYASYYSKRTTTSQKSYYDDNGGIGTREGTDIFLLGSEFWWRNINYLKYNVVAGGLLIQSAESEFTYKITDVSTKVVSNNTGKNTMTYFKPAATDATGEAKKDVLEIISLIKNIVKLYGGGEVKVDINEI